jgi:hypothetical protein
VKVYEENNKAVMSAFLNCQMLILITSLRILQSLKLKLLLQLWVVLLFLDLLADNGTSNNIILGALALVNVVVVCCFGE